jgi:hypothetical protein
VLRCALCAGAGEDGAACVCADLPFVPLGAAALALLSVHARRSTALRLVGHTTDTHKGQRAGQQDTHMSGDRHTLIASPLSHCALRSAAPPFCLSRTAVVSSRVPFSPHPLWVLPPSTPLPWRCSVPPQCPLWLCRQACSVRSCDLTGGARCSISRPHGCCSQCSHCRYRHTLQLKSTRGWRGRMAVGGCCWGRC